MSEKIGCEFIKVWTLLTQEDEALERYKRPSEGFAPVGRLAPNHRGLEASLLEGLYQSNLSYERYPRSQNLDSCHQCQLPRQNDSPDLAHTIMNTKNARLVRVAFMVLLYTNVFNGPSTRCKPIVSPSPNARSDKRL